MTKTRWPVVEPALAWAGTAFAGLAGTALQLQQPVLWPAAPLLGLALMAALGVAVAWRWRRLMPVWLLLMAAVFALSFVLTATRAQWRLDQALLPALEGQDLLLTGQVVSLPRQSLTGTHFVFELEAAQQAGQPLRPGVDVPVRLTLGWYRSVDDDALLGGPPLVVQAGQRWRFTARLRQPHGTLNPHGFDLELWLFEQGIRASGTVRHTAASRAELLHNDAGSPVQRLRQRVRDAIELRVQPPALAGVLAALVVGDQAAIDRAEWDVFRTTGVAHLMSISGLHVTMFAWLAAALVGTLWRLQPRALLWLPAQQAARWGGLAGAVAYALLAGWGVPAQRTVFMLATVVLVRSAGLRWPLLAVLLAAAWVVALLDPWALLQPGFWLSFMAVGLLASAEPVRDTQGPQVTPGALGHQAVPPLVSIWQRLAEPLRHGLRTQAVATVGLAPLSLVFFQQLSVVGFAANLLAIPLVTLFITPLAMLGVLVPPLWAVAAWVVQGLMLFLQALAAVPWAVWNSAAAPPWAVVSGLLAALLAIAPLPRRLRMLALPLMLPLLAPPVPRPGPGQFEVLVADIGQGTAALIRTQHHLLLYDTGPRYSRESDAGVRVLLPLLRARGEREVSLLMLSHRDTDHVGGAAAVLAGWPVRAVRSSLESSHPLLAQAAQLQVPHTPCTAGQRWHWDGVDFEVLHPTAADLARAEAGSAGRSLKPNALSCVLRVQAGAHSVLLTGDIEAAQEAALVAQQAAGSVSLRSQVLLVPHHGSRTSSTPAFIDAVAPELAVVQAGYRSRFGHPAPDVVARYTGRGISVLRSDRCGALLWRPGAAAESLPALGLECQRQVAQRYWHHPGGQGGPPLARH